MDPFTIPAAEVARQQSEQHTPPPVTTRTLTDRIALAWIERMLGARDRDDLDVYGSVAVEDIEERVALLGKDGALTVTRHAGSASRARALELADLHADRLAVSA